MKQALLIAAIDPLIGGVLVFGDRGTGKSTAVRSLARTLAPDASGEILSLSMRSER
jgi:magnesium chelatase subunit I